METRIALRVLHPTMLPWIGAGDPDPHCRQGWTSLFGDDLWRVNETKKARSVVALSSVPRGERGAPVSPPAVDRWCEEAAFFLRRLSGLLSGCPPTDTLQQARAKLGICDIGASRSGCKSFSHLGSIIFGGACSSATRVREPRAPVEIGGARRPAAIAWAQPFWLYPRHILADRRDKPD